MKETFSARLKRLREAKHWNLSELGSRSNLSTAAIAALEVDSNKVPSWIVVRKLARALATNPFYLASGDGYDMPYQALHGHLTDASGRIPRSWNQAA